MASPVAVIVNAAAGAGRDAAALDTLRSALERAGLDAQLLAARSGAETLELAQAAARERPAILVAAGGDGTVNSVATVAREHGLALGVLPLGTLNHFAKGIGIPADIDGAAAVLATGERRQVDCAEVNGRLFLNNSSLGIYPWMVRERDRRQRSGERKLWALAWATLSALRRAPFLSVEVGTATGAARRYRTPFVFIGNNEYVMEGFSIGSRASVEGGILSAYVMQHGTRRSMLALGLRALTGRLRQARDFEVIRAEALVVDTRHRVVPVATDGEVALMRTPLRYRVHRRGLTVVAPPAAKPPPEA